MFNSKNIEELRVMIDIQVAINEERLTVEQVYELLKGLGNERMMNAFLLANNLKRTTNDTKEERGF